ncbi:unnamed protein product [Polarella glacialis]|uniref:Serine/threonine-protein phosphatase PGAM5, mitochondrial n=1 Tax=Polarella glacialis TaxID=89957 RepID=A0A813HTR2_POLGL|nr:unnamed protein product [Polarella glacialis]
MATMLGRSKPMLGCRGRALVQLCPVCSHQSASSVRWASGGASSSAAERMRAPAGYFLPRLAVGTLAAVACGAAIELAGRYLAAPPPQEDEDWGTWNEAWDQQLAADVAAAGDQIPQQTAAALAAAEQLRRTSSDRRVGTRHVIFVRHGQPGSDRTPLSSEGLRQAELTGKRLRAQFGEVAAVFHSPSPEARATAEAIRPGQRGRKREGGRTFGRRSAAGAQPRSRSLGGVARGGALLRRCSG